MPDSALSSAKKFDEMSDDEFRLAARDIITTSSSVAEMCTRLSEMGYTFSRGTSLGVGPIIDDDTIGALGGHPRLNDGTMIIMALHGPSGKSVRL